MCKYVHYIVNLSKQMLVIDCFLYCKMQNLALCSGLRAFELEAMTRASLYKSSSKGPINQSYTYQNSSALEIKSWVWAI